MKNTEPFDWQRLFLGDDFPLLFLGEIVFRSVVMYLLILVALRITGKRGVKQLSLFELTIILGLGSAAGDAMFYEDVPILHALVVFVVVVLLYIFFNRLTERSLWVEQLLEGKPACVIDNGLIDIKVFKHQNLTYNELFEEMRQKQIEHLGQVRKVYLESTGDISVFFAKDEDVKPGLPIFPEILDKPLTAIKNSGKYACIKCGKVLDLQPAPKHICLHCGNELWLPAIQVLRIP